MSDAFPERPKSTLEEMGDRCLIVCREHAEDKEADIRLLVDFLWALNIEATITFGKKT